eukprot:CAMPEP_0118657886 /NCGR_PEP_ID=MMETSP0785-20121206/14264_1 /TAXON_ID=91992 /ORGANISM="Bolidomonas pacifica, Strain CCMP 1866" /LENGTH=166 /DNA_ID=CAMNT_0006550847 /DNA_START=240 /DNA_END=737 /DNA_ORIENTATION=+
MKAAKTWDEYERQREMQNNAASARRAYRQATRVQDGGYSPSSLWKRNTREGTIKDLEGEAEKKTEEDRGNRGKEVPPLLNSPPKPNLNPTSSPHTTTTPTTKAPQTPPIPTPIFSLSTYILHLTLLLTILTILSFGFVLTYEVCVNNIGTVQSVSDVGSVAKKVSD